MFSKISENAHYFRTAFLLSRIFLIFQNDIRLVPAFRNRIYLNPVGIFSVIKDRKLPLHVAFHGNEHAALIGGNLLFGKSHLPVFLWLA